MTIPTIVWAVSVCPYEGDWYILGVFSTKDKAEKALELLLEDPDEEVSAFEIEDMIFDD